MRRMRGWGVVSMWVGLLALTTMGCRTYGSVKRRFAQDFDCHDNVRVDQAFGEAKYSVIGCGQLATYVCIGGVCELSGDGSSGTPASTAASGGVVRREFDAQRQEEQVWGTFEVDRLTVTLVSIPAREPGVIYVRVGYAAAQPHCAAFNLAVNKRPLPAGQPDVQSDSGRVSIGQRFRSSDFRPLASRFPEFAVVACGSTFEFSPAQVASLQKFLVIEGELARSTASMPVGAHLQAPVPAPAPAAPAPQLNQ